MAEKRDSGKGHLYLELSKHKFLTPQ